MSKFLWNVYALCYDAVVGLGPYQDMLGEVVDALELSPGMRVLDAGCGTGALAERIAVCCPNIELQAVDLSPTMLKRARGRRRWPAGFAFVEGNLDQALAADERGFDRIASVNVLWTLPEPHKTLAEMKHALRDGGRMVHTTPRWRFQPRVIVWDHLRRLKGRALGRFILGLPVLIFAGLLNLLLVGQSLWNARGPRARERWHAEGLTRLLGEPNGSPCIVRPCYAGQGHLLIWKKESGSDAGTRLPGPGSRL